jgi:endonuclease/exonuclease/phosphatase family metal-dependent hydrolase
MHGGSAPQVKAAAERRRHQAAALAAVETYGLPREVAPDVALLEEVHRTAGHVAWLAKIVRGLGQDELVWSKAEEEHIGASEFGGTNTTSKAQPNVWLQIYQTERKHLAQVAKAALDAGVAERQVRLAEQQGSVLAGVIHRILGRLGLTPEQRALVATVVPEELRAVTDGSATA